MSDEICQNGEKLLVRLRTETNYSVPSIYMSLYCYKSQNF